MPAAVSADEVREHRALRWHGGKTSERIEKLAVEEPLEIRLAGRRFTLTMRTPGHDEELAAGFLFAEGFINDASELGEIRRVRGRKGAPEPNAIDIILNVPADGLRSPPQAQLRDELELRRMRQDQHRLDSAPRRTRLGFRARRAGHSARAVGEAPRRPARVCRDGRTPRRRDLQPRRHDARDTRGRRASQRGRQGDRIRADECDGPAGASSDDGQRAAQLRDRAEGRGRRRADSRRRVGAVVAGGRAGRRSSARRWSASCATAASTSTRAPTESRRDAFPPSERNRKVRSDSFTKGPRGTTRGIVQSIRRRSSGFFASDFRLDGTGRLLDLGCGPGPVAIALAHLFDEVVAMDPDDAMRAEGERIARERGISNIEWRFGGSKDLSPALGQFRLVTMGNSFHWMDRARTLDALYDLVTDGGGIAVVGEGAPIPPPPHDAVARRD